MPTTTKSTRPISATEITRSWHVIDMQGKTLGREMGQITDLLQGKSKRNYAPYLDAGDFVIVINAKGLKTTGKKGLQKEYDRYSGYQSGRSTLTLDEMMIRKPTEVVREAVSGMLPKNKHRDARLARLYIFADENHPYTHKLQKTEKSE
ncbi:50S ribosomal protein L13 [Candidatus Woesebacteria bacterium]|nr:50S ribosomal protein L13 [Candidatus Woesebacteria bacterium]